MCGRDAQSAFVGELESARPSQTHETCALLTAIITDGIHTYHQSISEALKHCRLVDVLHAWKVAMHRNCEEGFELFSLAAEGKDSRDQQPLEISLRRQAHPNKPSAHQPTNQLTEPTYVTERTGNGSRTTPNPFHDVRVGAATGCGAMRCDAVRHVRTQSDESLPPSTSLISFVNLKGTRSRLKKRPPGRWPRMNPKSMCTSVPAAAQAAAMTVEVMPRQKATAAAAEGGNDDDTSESTSARMDITHTAVHIQPPSGRRKHSSRGGGH